MQCKLLQLAILSNHVHQSVVNRTRGKKIINAKLGCAPKARDSRGFGRGALRRGGFGKAAPCAGAGADSGHAAAAMELPVAGHPAPFEGQSSKRASGCLLMRLGSGGNGRPHTAAAAALGPPFPASAALSPRAYPRPHRLCSSFNKIATRSLPLCKIVLADQKW
jgi:hypothetical protein